MYRLNFNNLYKRRFIMEKKIELSNGDIVNIRGCFNTGNGSDIIDVTDENGLLIAEFVGVMPDFDDEDFNKEAFIEKVENEISWFNY